MVEISHGDLKVWNDDGDDESLKTPKNDNDSRAGEWDDRRGLRLPQTTQPASNTQGVHRSNEICTSNLPIILSSSNATSCCFDVIVELVSRCLKLKVHFQGAMLEGLVWSSEFSAPPLSLV